jgi:hypothetical protein
MYTMSTSCPRHVHVTTMRRVLRVWQVYVWTTSNKHLLCDLDVGLEPLEYVVFSKVGRGSNLARGGIARRLDRSIMSGVQIILLLLVKDACPCCAL